jgi:phospholysine phosphohistidine inorganic pyrophosphate phosphatase
MPGILFDLDGVFYVGERAIPGAAETLAWVRQHAIPHCFLTNTTSKPRSALVSKLSGLGLTAREEEILTPPVAACRWINTHLDGPVALFVPPATESEFSSLNIVPRNSEGPLGAVVIGDLGKAWDYATLNQAFRLLMRQPQPQLIALGMTRYWLAYDGLRLDVAPFITALQHATGREPLVLGKPAAPFFSAALEMISCLAQETVMIGADIKGDVGAAQQAGVGSAILVRTGKFKEDDLQGDIQPDALLDSIADLPAWWTARFIDD